MRHFSHIILELVNQKWAGIEEHSGKFNYFFPSEWNLLESFQLIRNRSSILITLLTSGSVLSGEVTTLAHELWDDTMEGRSLVSVSLLSSAQSSEVLTGLGNNISIQDHVNSTNWFIVTGARAGSLNITWLSFSSTKISQHRGTPSNLSAMLELKSLPKFFKHKIKNLTSDALKSFWNIVDFLPEQNNKNDKSD